MSGAARVCNPPPTVTVVLSQAILNLFPAAIARSPVTAATVAELIDALDNRWPGMGDRLCDSSPAIRKHINIFANGERAVLSTRLQQGSDVFVITAVSGG